jgi:hypothetical protein
MMNTGLGGYIADAKEAVAEKSLSFRRHMSRPKLPGHLAQTNICKIIEREYRRPLYAL